MASRAASRAVRHCVALALRPPHPRSAQLACSFSPRLARGVVAAHPLTRAPALVNGWRTTQVASFSSEPASKMGPMNGDIQASFVSVVGDDGKMRRDIPLSRALEEARSNGVDLVQVANNNGHVVCRMFNAQKRLFALKKALKQSKPKQDKEVTFGVKTEANDIKTKATQLRGFLSKGHKVKVTCKFGKEFHLLDRALEQLKNIEEALGPDVGVPDHKPQNQFGGVYVHFVPRSSK